jgi:hypothetical protein
MASKKKDTQKKAVPRKRLAKKAIPKRNISSEKRRTKESAPIRVLVELVVRCEELKVASRWISSDMTGGEPKPNFKFKFNIPNGVKLSLIDLDGDLFYETRLVKCSEETEPGKLKVEMYSNPGTTPIPLIVEAVGEPNREVSFSLKFNDKDVYKEDNPQKFKIVDNRRGRIIIQEMHLP